MGSNGASPWIDTAPAGALDACAAWLQGLQFWGGLNRGAFIVVSGILFYFYKGVFIVVVGGKEESFYFFRGFLSNS